VSVCNARDDAFALMHATAYHRTKYVVDVLYGDIILLLVYHTSMECIPFPCSFFSTTHFVFDQFASDGTFSEAGAAVVMLHQTPDTPKTDEVLVLLVTLPTRTAPDCASPSSIRETKRSAKMHVCSLHQAIGTSAENRNY